MSNTLPRVKWSFPFKESSSSVLLKFNPTLFFLSALEPFFNASASQFILGQPIPLTLWLSLAPVVIGNLLLSCYCVIVYLAILVRDAAIKGRVQ